ncbi:MAG: molybdate ABC transporter permease subunit [Thermoleophilia bacterium]|nr:molybdate ABC transporter permease subunit [Actinomycetota bacterium]MCL6092572.1 molybdate ABC transporter permease subunit [Actinomycetota bacterium]MDA8166864.1 molybdate ABC transporter permease subunit [Actinomycetota bacterium]
MNALSLFSLRLSLQVALAATALVVPAGIGLAYLLARRSFRGRDLLDIILTLPLVMPPTVTGYYLVIVLGRNGPLGGLIYSHTGWSIMFTWEAAVLASSVVAMPLMVKTARAAFESVERNLIETSETLGHSGAATFFHVTLPLARRGLFAGATLSFARALGEFGATLMLAGNIPGKTSTAPLAIYTYASSGDWPRANSLVLLFTAISALFLYVAVKLNARII